MRCVTYGVEYKIEKEPYDIFEMQSPENHDALGNRLCQYVEHIEDLNRTGQRGRGSKCPLLVCPVVSAFYKLFYGKLCNLNVLKSRE